MFKRVKFKILCLAILIVLLYFLFYFIYIFFFGQSRTEHNQWNGPYYTRQGNNGYIYGGAAYGASSNGHGNHEQPVS